MNEYINILLFSYMVFHLWEIILVEWGRCNILDGSNDVPAKLPKPIRKLAFGCLANMKECQLEKLARRFIS